MDQNYLTGTTYGFIKKAQNIMRELINEYKSLDDEGLQYSCPFTDLMDEVQYFANMDVQEAAGIKADVDRDDR